MSEKKLSSREKKLHEMLLPVVEKGYTISEITEALREVEKSFAEKKAHPGFLSNITAAQVLLFVGGVITVLGGVFIVAISWQDLNSFFRILAIFLPFFATLSAGVLLKRTKESTQVATVFAVVSSLLWPLLLLVFFNETKLLDPFESELQGAIYAALSTIYFALMAYFFRSTVWSLLYTLSTFVGYMFLYEYFEIELLGPNTIYWGALLLGLGFFGLHYALFKKGLGSFGRYGTLVTLAVSLISIIMMMSIHPVESTATWYLLVPVVIYFLFACFNELENNEDLAKVLYFLASVTLFLMLMKLSLGGRLLNFTGEESSLDFGMFSGLSNQGFVGGSFAISGLIFLGLSYLSHYIKKYNLVILSSFAQIFELIGTWLTLGGIFVASLGDKKVFVELLLGFVSVLAIFFSTVRQSRIFLYSGTVFLVIFIFDIGAEYFADALSWPITLLLSGIVSMVIGYYMGRLQKQFNAEERSDS